jgi:sodium transport system permease protein
MRFRKVYSVVFRKELRELLRDRRSLFWLFAPPIILPGLAICAGLFIGTQAVRIASDGFPVWIENGDQAPELVQRFAEDDAVHLVDPPPNPERDPFGEALIIVSPADGFQDRIARGEPASLQIITRDNSVITFLAQSTVNGIVNSYNDHLVDRRLAAEGLNRDWLNPIQVNQGQRAAATTVAGVGDKESGGSNVLATIFLPLAVTSWLIGGGMGLILDTTVGEKEHQTIENLLVTPASRAGIVLGKLTVVFIASILVMSLWLTEGLLLNGLSAAGPKILDSGSLSSADALDLLLKSSKNVIGLVAALLILIVPFIVTLNGLVMAWCARAANYREANLFMVLMQLGLPASILLTIFSFPANIATPVYAIPFLGTIVAIRDLFSNTLSTSGLTVNVLSGIIYAAFTIGLAAWVFNREWSLTRGLQ